MKKPVKPWFNLLEPQKEKTVFCYIDIDEYYNLNSLLKELPEGIDYNDVTISRLDSDREYGEEQKLVLQYNISFENVTYETELVKYRKDQEQHNVAMKVYKKKLKEYERWKTLPDSEKRKLAKQEKIAALEAQLERLKK